MALSLNDRRLAELKPPDFHRTHGFQNLRAFLREAQYRSVIIGDTDHDNRTVRNFLLGPFFNLSVLAATGRGLVAHEVRSANKGHFEKLHNTAAQLSENAKDAISGFTETLVSEKQMLREEAKLLGETVAIGGAMDIDIIPGDARAMHKRPEDTFFQEESEWRETILKEKLGIGAPFINAAHSENIATLQREHERIFGKTFEGYTETFLKIVGFMAVDDLDAERYRYAEVETAKLLTTEAQGKPFAYVVGSAHLGAELAQEIQKSSRYAPVELDIGSGLLTMAEKMYARGKASPVYLLWQDEIVHPRDVPTLNHPPEKFAEFKSCVLDFLGIGACNALAPARALPKPAFVELAL